MAEVPFCACSVSAAGPHVVRRRKICRLSVPHALICINGTALNGGTAARLGASEIHAPRTAWCDPGGHGLGRHPPLRFPVASRALRFLGTVGVLAGGNPCRPAMCPGNQLAIVLPHGSRWRNADSHALPNLCRRRLMQRTACGQYQHSTGDRYLDLVLALARQLDSSPVGSRVLAYVRCRCKASAMLVRAGVALPLVRRRPAPATRSTLGHCLT